MATIMPANDFLGSATGLLRLRRRPPPPRVSGAPGAREGREWRGWRGGGGGGGGRAGLGGGAGGWGGENARVRGEARPPPRGAVGAAGAARPPAAPGRAEVRLVQV